MKSMRRSAPHSPYRMDDSWDFDLRVSSSPNTEVVSIPLSRQASSIVFPPRQQKSSVYFSNTAAAWKSCVTMSFRLRVSKSGVVIIAPHFVSKGCKLRCNNIAPGKPEEYMMYVIRVDFRGKLRLSLLRLSCTSGVPPEESRSAFRPSFHEFTRTEGY